MNFPQKPSLHPQVTHLLFHVGDVISKQLPSVQNPAPLSYVVVAVMEILFHNCYCWEVQCHPLLSNGAWSPTSLPHTFCQYIGTSKTDHLWEKVGRCYPRIHFEGAVFNPPPKPPEPTTIYILPFNRVFVAYEASRGFLSTHANGTQYWQQVPSNATWFNDPPLARAGVARWVDANLDDLVGSSIRFVNPAIFPTH